MCCSPCGAQHPPLCPQVWPVPVGTWGTSKAPAVITAPSLSQHHPPTLVRAELTAGLDPSVPGLVPTVPQPSSVATLQPQAGSGLGTPMSPRRAEA